MQPITLNIMPIITIVIMPQFIYNSIILILGTA